MMEHKWLNPDTQLGVTTCEGLALENFRRIKLEGIGSNPAKNYATDKWDCTRVISWRGAIGLNFLFQGP